MKEIRKITNFESVSRDDLTKRAVIVLKRYAKIN